VLDLCVLKIEGHSPQVQIPNKTISLVLRKGTILEWRILKTRWHSNRLGFPSVGRSWVRSVHFDSAICHPYLYGWTQPWNFHWLVDASPIAVFVAGLWEIQHSKLCSFRPLWQSKRKACSLHIGGPASALPIYRRYLPDLIKVINNMSMYGARSPQPVGKVQCGPTRTHPDNFPSPLWRAQIPNLDYFRSSHLSTELIRMTDSLQLNTADLIWLPDRFTILWLISFPFDDQIALRGQFCTNALSNRC